MRARGHDHCPTGQNAAVAELGDQMARLFFKTHCFARRGEHRAELASLRQRSIGELEPGDAGGKAEVVLDPRALPRLASGGDPLDKDRAQPL